jgi:hypothetical protein
MSVRWDLWYDFGHWTTWGTLGAGLFVASVVYVVLSRIKRRRRQLAFANGELPWADLLEMLRARHHELEAAGSPPQENLSPDELLNLLLSKLPANRRCPPTDDSPEVPPEELAYLSMGSENRRSSRRRWGNPTEVSLTSFLWAGDRHGLVINRSTGGFAIFVDRKIEPGSTLTVRPLEAPHYVPSVEIEVKHCRKVRRNYIIGCQASAEVPWNVLAWFG